MAASRPNVERNGPAPGSAPTRGIYPLIYQDIDASRRDGEKFTGWIVMISPERRVLEGVGERLRKDAQVSERMGKKEVQVEGRSHCGLFA